MPADQANEIVVKTSRQLLRGSRARPILRDEPCGIRADDLADDPVETLETTMDSNRLRSVRTAESGFDALLLPLAGQSVPWGVIIVWLDRTADEFTHSLAKIVRMETGTALDHLHIIAALSHEATIDTLTGIGNRRLADAAITELQPGDAIILVGLDKLRLVNDTLGHAAGDAIIRAFAEWLSNGLHRDADMVARLGGDEFARIANGIGESSGAAEDRRRDRWMRTQPLSSVSIGIAVHDGDVPPTITLDRADSALYLAKEAGGNHVRRHGVLRTDGARRT
jgi:diguanylate cyclase (GGDEF)-like protein